MRALRQEMAHSFFSLWISKIRLFRQMLGIYYSVPWAHRDVIIAGKFQVFSQQSIFTNLIYHHRVLFPKTASTVRRGDWLTKQELIGERGRDLACKRFSVCLVWLRCGEKFLHALCMLSSSPEGRSLMIDGFDFLMFWIGGVVGQGLVIIGLIIFGFTFDNWAWNGRRYTWVFGLGVRIAIYCGSHDLCFFFFSHSRIDTASTNLMKISQKTAPLCSDIKSMFKQKSFFSLRSLF